jgi:hypothetical protein
MNIPSYLWRFGERWNLEIMLCWGLLVGFTILVKPTAGVAINLGPLTVMIWRAGF